MPGLIGEKLGMTQIFDAAGKWVPVTVISAGPCNVIQKKLKEKEGYSAVQIGFGQKKEKNVTKALAGHFKSKNVSASSILKEFTTDHVDDYTPGQSLTVALFQPGDVVHISGVSKGKGFQGVMKRHNFAGGRATHGCSVSHRSAGSIGQRTWPGKVWKGKKMAGQMGNKNVTVKNLMVVGIEADRNLLLIKGAVPGANHSFVFIHPGTGEFEKRVKGSKKEAVQAPVVEKTAEETLG